MSRHVKVWGAVICALTVLATGACSGEPATVRPGASASGAPAVPGREAFDPPTKFDTGAGVDLPIEGAASVGVDPDYPVALHGTTAFTLDDDRLSASDTVTGETTVVTPAGPEGGDGIVTSDSLQEPPVVADVDGAFLALAGFGFARPAVGTEQGGSVIQLLAVDAVSGRLAWTLDIVPPEGYATDAVVGGVIVKGAVGGTLILAATSEDYGGDQDLFAVDLRARQVVWQKPDTAAQFLSGDLVVVSFSQDPDVLTLAVGVDSLTAFAVADGGERWKLDEKEPGDYDEVAYGYSVMAAGPARIYVTRDDPFEHEDLVRAFDPATGEVLETDKEEIRRGCVYDGQAVVICGITAMDDFEYSLTAFDAETWEPLWSLPDDDTDRVAPGVTTAWHGAVYGRTDNGSVVLDGRTGADLETRPGLAPRVVNEYVGVGTGELGQRLACPAVG